MPRMTVLDGAEVRSASGAHLGTVSGVLFHPVEPRVVGLAVLRPRLMVVVARPPVYIALSSVTFEERSVVLGAKKLPSSAEGAKTIGASWDDTVLWEKMPVLSTGGTAVGAVGDATFDAATGALRTLNVSTGIMGDLAVGRLDIPGELVERFDGNAVLVRPDYADLHPTGGAAKAAAKTTSAAKEAGARVAKQAYDTGMSAAIAVGKSFKSGTGRRMLDKFREMTRDEDEE